MIEGLSHLTFIVKDIEKAARFFQELFDAKEVYSSGEQTFSVSKEKFFLIGELWIAVMEGESLPTRTYNHVAFKIEQDDLDDYIRKIEALGLDFKDGRSRVEGEGSSIYFYDYDNHLFELHTGTLEERLGRYQQ
ncbi:FosX/FosE/FosI family fosfomycin resistance hydrolase [Enterococcus sp. LJL128]|uniref:FosX/FosE/FosI family fosfomycin resistance hydrolase n=1 Tax=Enterococcus sp. LJL51 TaxID=3416656 RepID=UPI003CEEB23D